METTEPSGETYPDAHMLTMNPGQMTGADDPTQPTTLAPTSGPAQTPPTTSSAGPTTDVGATPFGAALWLAFVFGVGSTLLVGVVNLVFTTLEQPLSASAIGPSAPTMYAVAILVGDFLLPIALIVVAWRARRRSGGPGVGRLIGALTLLVALGSGPGVLGYALTFLPATIPIAAGLLSLLEPEFRVGVFALPFLVIAILIPVELLVALSAAFAWGGWGAATRGPARGAARWLGFARSLAVGVSASLGLITYNLVYSVLSTYFYGYPYGAQYGYPQDYTVQHAIVNVFEQFNYSPFVFFSVLGAAVGGLLTVGGFATRANATDAPMQPTGQRMRWGRNFGVGVALFALGAVATLSPLGVLVILVQLPNPLPEIAYLGLTALAPTIILIVALRVGLRGLGARSGWRIVGLTALSYAPLILDTLVLALVHRIDANDIIDVLASDARVALVFGVGLALGVVFGSRNRLRWRGQAAAIGVLVGLGFALVYVALAAVGWTSAQGPCSGLSACVLIADVRTGMSHLLVLYALEGFALALVGATVGGWLRASAPPAPAARFVDIAG